MRVAILWHMHQPSYWEADLGKYRYPWAFLHAARHYHMMGLLARENPEAAMTINITSVLMEQIDDYSRDDFKDRILDVVRKPASSLEEDDMELLLEHVFKLNVSTMITPFPRYRELKHLVEAARTKPVPLKEILDLQVWYLLTWMGPHLRRQGEIAELFKKGKHFTEEDKETAFRACHAAVREVIPLYRDLAARGRVEISTTPYFHPILPLLIDCDSAKESRPGVQLDGVSFRFPEDARWHVEEAIRAYTSRFGHPPAGMWPAEGSISNEALALLRDCGMTWAASDEGVLARSLGRHPLSEEERHKPYEVGNGLRVFFRDHELSDRVGFVYSSWQPERAADDLVGRLLGIRERLGKKEASACVSIILDGENPWEHYPDCGVGFLSRLYRALVTTPGLETVRLGDQEVFNRRQQRLASIVPGSWIDANFDTWIGAPEKNRAWMQLAAARQQLAAEAPHQAVPREVYRAEGSDWFWWLGPGHDTPYEASYENLFRTNLIQALAQVSLEAPPVLKTPRRILHTPLFQPPLHLFTPRISGRVGNYYDWIAGGFYRSSDGSTHRSSRLIERLRFGFNLKTFFLRAEGSSELQRTVAGELSLLLEFRHPRVMRFLHEDGLFLIVPSEGNGDLDSAGRAEDPKPDAAGALFPRLSSGQAVVDSVAEAAVPLEELGARVGDVLDFALSLCVGPDVIERLPGSGFLSVTVPGAGFDMENWSA
ncbi:MAG TPA: glycoside hydrolase family 57 protein [Planctomycetota bacterium]|nr:glycoside hydrolase family 57 protein [Planctomycetota bacterium]